MMELLWLCGVSFAAALSGAVVPGPVFGITVTESLRRGFVAGPLIVLGHLLVEVVILFLVFLGLGSVLGSELVQLAIGYVGGLMLMVMGAFLVKSSRNVHMDAGSEKNSKLSSHGPVIAGFLASASNPHFFLWWVTIGLPVMYRSVQLAGLAGFIAFSLGHAAGDLAWFGFVSYTVHGGRKFLSARVIKYIILGSAVFLEILGASFIYSAIQANLV